MNKKLCDDVDDLIAEYGMQAVVQRLFTMSENTCRATMKEQSPKNPAALRFTLACGMLCEGFSAIEQFAKVFDQHTRNADGTVAFPIDKNPSI